MKVFHDNFTNDIKTKLINFSHLRKIQQRPTSEILRQINGNTSTQAE